MFLSKNVSLYFPLSLSALLYKLEWGAWESSRNSMGKHFNDSLSELSSLVKNFSPLLLLCSVAWHAFSLHDLRWISGALSLSLSPAISIKELMLSVWGASDKGVIGCVRAHIINGGCATWVSILSNGNILLISSLKELSRCTLMGGCWILCVPLRI